MAKIIISAEATCDLDSALSQNYGINVIPMEFTVGNDRYDTVTGLAPSECYKRMRAGALTGTCLINEVTAAEHFEKLLKDGADVFHVGFSSTLSGTYDNVARAAKELEKKYPGRIVAVDTMCGSFGQGLLAIMCKQLADKGASLNEIAAYVQEQKNSICHEFISDDLIYFSRSGRIAKIIALFGNTINMKLQMFLGVDGKFHVGKKVLTRKKSVMALADNVIGNFSGECNTVFVAHADCPEEADYLASRIEAGIGVKPVISEFGMVIGSHCGPGTLGAFYHGKKRGK